MLAVIGGRAHINGITFVTNTHIVRGKLAHGTVSINIRRLPWQWVFNQMDKVPFLRGVARLIKLLNHKLLLASIFLLAIPWDRIFPYNKLVVTESVVLELAFYGFPLILSVVLLKRLWQFHGAEHKVLNSYMKGGDLSLSAVRKASRVSERCGTNVIVIAFPFIILLYYVMIPGIILVVALLLGFKVIKWRPRNNWLKPATWLASFIQKYIVTAEPTDAQIELAIATLSRAIEYDGSQTFFGSVKILRFPHQVG